MSRRDWERGGDTEMEKELRKSVFFRVRGKVFYKLHTATVNEIYYTLEEAEDFVRLLMTDKSAEVVLVIREFYDVLGGEDGHVVGRGDVLVKKYDPGFRSGSEATEPSEAALPPKAAAT